MSFWQSFCFSFGAEAAIVGALVLWWWLGTLWSSPSAINMHGALAGVLAFCALCMAAVIALVARL